MKDSFTTEAAASNPGSGAPRIRDLVGYFLRLGTLGFGGPVALCGLMEKELVQDRGWLTKQEMRDPSPSRNRFPDLSPSRSVFSFRIFAAAFGALGQAAGPSFCLTF